MKKLQKISLAIMAGLLLVGTLTNMTVHATVPGTNTLISINNTGDGQGGNESSPVSASTKGDVQISADGRYVIFISAASNLVAGDTNGYTDVFVRDLQNNTTTRVNVSSSGVQANDRVNSSSNNPIAISRTGRYVVFPSLATNLIDGQTTATNQLYIRDMATNTIALVSQKSDGTLTTKGVKDVGGVSDDGRFVTWTSRLDTNFVSTSETNTTSDYIYLADLKDRTFKVLNSVTDTSQHFLNGVTMNCDGSFIAFATNVSLVAGDIDSSDDVYLVDIRNGLTITNATASTSGSSILPTISCNGVYLLSTTSGHKYLYDRINSTAVVVDTSTAGTLANSGSDGVGGVDDQGNTVFSSKATNLRDGSSMAANQLFLKHKDTGVTELLSRASGGSAWSSSNSFLISASLSADGKMAAYSMLATTSTNLLNSDTNGYRDVIVSTTGL